MVYILCKSTRKDKKYMVMDTEKGDIIHFGSKNNKDYIIYNEENKYMANDKKRAYIKRHSKLNEDWTNIKTAGFWSRWILWNMPTLDESIKNVEERFNIKILNCKNKIT